MRSPCSMGLIQRWIFYIEGYSTPDQSCALAVYGPLAKGET